MSSSGNCGICSNLTYDSSSGFAKPLPCGLHDMCLDCFIRLGLQPKMANPPECIWCSETNRTTVIEELTTKATIADEASTLSILLYCDDCKRVADGECKKQGHPSRSLHQAQQAMINRSNVLKGVLPKVLEMKDISKKKLLETRDDLTKTSELTQRLNSVVNSGAAGADLDAVLRDAGERALGLPLLERGLALLELDQGLCRLEVQGGGETWAASLDLGNAANLKPEIRAAAQFLMYLLGKEGYMQKLEKGEKTLRTGEALVQAGQGQEQQRQKCQKPPSQQHWPSSQDHRGAEQQDPQNDGHSTLDAALDNGVLDLGHKARGRTPLEATEKAAILASTKMMRHMIVNNCSEDSEFYVKVLKKHAPHIQTLELRQVTKEHVDVLRELRNLRHLKLEWVKFKNAFLIDKTPQPESVLRSMHVILPVNVQFDLWEVFASSLIKITLGIEVSMFDIFKKVHGIAAKSPKLRSVILCRYRDHTPVECGVQLDLFRAVVGQTVTVSCYLCRKQANMNN